MPTKQARLDRRLTFLVRILVPVIVGLVLTAGALLGFVLWSAGRVDEQSLQRQTALARHVIQTQLTRIPHDQQSITIWDESIKHLRASDLSWVDDNLGSWMFTYFGHDDVIIIDGAGTPVYDLDEGKSVAPESARAKLADLAPLIAELRTRINSGAIDAYLDGSGSLPEISDMVRVDGLPALVSIQPIVSDSGEMRQEKGTEYFHISMVRLDADYAQRLSSEYLIDHVGFSDRASDTDGRSAIPLTNEAGRFITFFEWNRSTPGRAIVSQTIPAIAAAFFLAALVAFVLVDQLWRKSAALATEKATALHEATHDRLTDLPNRASLEATLASQLAQPRSAHQHLTLLVLDLDRFKAVNDALGHRAGDELIRAVGRRLKDLIGPGDMLARLAGDEFAIIQHHTGGLHEPLDLSQRIIDAIGKPFDVDGKEAFVGASIGIAGAEPDDRDARELGRRADIALYEAKGGGRNRAVVFERAMSELLESTHTIEAELREALRRSDQLSVAYQPLYHSDRTICGAEALARWTHPKLGQISPAHFISVAEQTGLVEPLGEMILRRACAMGARHPGLTFAVNMSPVQLRNPTFPPLVFSILRETGMRPADLELEITEGILLGEESVAVEAIQLFRSAGIRIALDDFGTGYSSLNYLKRYPVDRIKIDRSFVTQLGADAVPAAIVQAMVTLAHALKIEVTAEGVETRDQMSVLTNLGCDVFQGYLLSPPVAPEAFEALTTPLHVQFRVA